MTYDISHGLLTVRPAMMPATGPTRGDQLPPDVLGVLLISFHP
jgi:hypothetical protein